MNVLASEHPIAAACVVFFAITQCVMFVLLLRSVLLLLEQLRRILAVPPDATSKTKCDGLPFITWCRQPPTSPFMPDGEQRRESALAEVDQWFGDLPTYQLLQRSGYTAPLLGVLITAFGFLSSDVMGSSETADQILRTVSPLVLGIAGGAFLAILSQLFLFSADLLLIRVRRLADNCYAHLTVPLDQCPGTQAFLDLADVSRTLHALFSSVPPQLAMLVEAASGADRTLAATGKAMQDMASTFTKSVTAFRETVDAELRPTLEAHGSTARSTNDIATICFESLQEFKTAAHRIEEAGTRLLETTDSYAKALDEAVMPSHRQLADTAKKVGAVATNLGKPLGDFLTATSVFSGALVESAGSLRQFGKMADEFGEGVRKHFLPAAEGHRSAVGNIEAASASLCAANDTFNKSLLLVAKTVHAHRDVGEQLVELVQEKAVPAHDMLTECVKRLDNSTTDLAHYTDGYTASVLHHAAEVTKLCTHVEALAKRLDNAVDRFTDVATHGRSTVTAHAAQDGDKQVADEVLKATGQLRACSDVLSQLHKEQKAQNKGIYTLLEGATTTNRKLLEALTHLSPATRGGAGRPGVDVAAHSALPPEDGQDRPITQRAEGTSTGFAGIRSLWQRRG